MQRHRLPVMTASMSWSLGVGKSFSKACRLHDLAGLAIAALRNLKVDPGLLQRMLSLGIEPFDRRDLGAGDAADRRDAGARGASAYMHGAGAAHADAAAEFGAGEADDVADDP